MTLEHYLALRVAAFVHFLTHQADKEKKMSRRFQTKVSVISTIIAAAFLVTTPVTVNAESRIKNFLTSFNDKVRDQRRAKTQEEYLQRHIALQKSENSEQVFNTENKQSPEPVNELQGLQENHYTFFIGNLNTLSGSSGNMCYQNPTMGDVVAISLDCVRGQYFPYIASRDTYIDPIDRGEKITDTAYHEIGSLRQCIGRKADGSFTRPAPCSEFES